MTLDQLLQWVTKPNFNDWLMLFFTGALVFFTRLTWKTYERLAELAKVQNTLTDRQNWLTGALESHSTTELIIRAHERGIPVVWWNPHREKWNPAQQWYSGDRHRCIAQQQFIVLYVPENERGPGDKKSAKEAKPFTEDQLHAIESERKRLEEMNAKFLGGKS